MRVLRRRSLRRFAAGARRALPTLLTLGNAGCGFLAIAKIIDALGAVADGSPDRMLQRLLTAASLVFLAMVFDALDGSVARWTGSSSRFGAMLDSIVDGISFGLVPALLIKVLAERVGMVSPRVATAAAFLFFACALLRLVRFTVREHDGEEDHQLFQGLPTPAAAGFVASGVLVYLYFQSAALPRPLLPLSGEFLPDLLRARGVLASHPMGASYVRLLLGTLPVLGLLMVSSVPYLHASRVLRRRFNAKRGLETMGLLLLLALIPELTLAALFGSYVVGGALRHGLEKLVGEEGPAEHVAWRRVLRGLRGGDDPGGPGSSA